MIVNTFSGRDLFKMVEQLIADDDISNERLTSTCAASLRALVVISESNPPQRVWAWKYPSRTTGIPELDRLLAADEMSHVAASYAANLYAAVTELSDAVAKGGTPVGVVGYIYDQCGFEAAFYYPLDKYADDADIRALLVDQEAALRAEQQAADAKNEQAHGGLEAPNPSEADEERDARRFMNLDE